MSSGDAILAEATRDSFWGVGVPPSQCRNSQSLKGQNVLGCLLMQLRDSNSNVSPHTLILCDSHGHRIDTNKISMNRDIYKQTTYTLNDTLITIDRTHNAPKNLYIQVGTNNVNEDPATIVKGLKEVVHKCHSKFPRTQLIIGSIPPMREEHSWTTINCVNREMSRFCNQNKVWYVCNDNIMQCQRPFTKDGIHLGPEGFFTLANNMTGAIMDL